MRSQFWHNALKKIIFKNIFEELNKNTQLLVTATENNNQNSENINEILEESKKQNTEIMKQNEIQITQQHEKFREQILKENNEQSQEIKKYLSEQITNQISEFREQILKESTEHYENLINENTAQNVRYIKQNKIEKLEYIKQSYVQNLKYILQNKRQLTEYVDKTIGQNKQEIKEFIEYITELGKQNKKEYENLIIQNKNQYTEMLSESRKHQRELIKKLSDILDNKITTYINQISDHTTQENTKVLKQISKNINNHNIKFIEQISEEGNKQNSVFIKQNTELIKEILAQSLQNHGTINEKFKELVNYHKLSEFRENLITIKTTIVILERLDEMQLKIFHNLYREYHRVHSEIPTLDVTQGIIIIKMLFPVFFGEILRNLAILKSQFENDVYMEMTKTIKNCDSFFKNFKMDHRLDKMKKMLDSDISIIDELLTKLID